MVSLLLLLFPLNCLLSTPQTKWNHSKKRNDNALYDVSGDKSNEMYAGEIDYYFTESESQMLYIKYALLSICNLHWMYSTPFSAICMDIIWTRRAIDRVSSMQSGCGVCSLFEQMLGLVELTTKINISQIYGMNLYSSRIIITNTQYYWASSSNQLRKRLLAIVTFHPIEVILFEIFTLLWISISVIHFSVLHSLPFCRHCIA